MRSWPPQAFERVPSVADQPPRDDPAAAPLAALICLWRGKLRIALTVLALMTIAVAYGAIAPRSYSATAVVALNEAQAPAMSLGGAIPGLAALTGAGASVYTEVEVLQSRNLIEGLVRAQSLTLDPEFNEALQPPSLFTRVIGLPVPDYPPEVQFDMAVDAVLDALVVANVRQSYVFRLTMTTSTPGKSATLANALSEHYILGQLENKFEETRRATAWLSERVLSLKSQLEIAETEVATFSAGITLVSPEALEAMNRQLKDLRERLVDTRATQALAQDKSTRLTTARAGTDLSEILSAADSAHLFALAQNSGADTAAFKRALALFAEAQKINLAKLSAQTASLSASIADLETRIRDQSDDLVQLTQLQRESEANRQIYEFFLTRLKESEVQMGMQQADARILSRAVLPQHPSTPRIALLLALAVLAGLVIGAVWVLLRATLGTARPLIQSR